MLLKTLVISALVVGMSSAAMAATIHKHHTTHFKAHQIRADVGNFGHSKDAILPNGVINTDPSVTGPIHSGDYFSRLQCDVTPNTNEGPSNTYDAALPSGCP